MAQALSLEWTDAALADLDDIAAWIAMDSMAAAAALIERTLVSVERLKRFPASGRRVPELLPGKQYREVIVPPCRIVYRREAKTVWIVYVARGERLLRPERLR